MEYAIYIYTHKQSQDSTKKVKYSRLTRGTKEITKLYLPVKNKNSQSTNLKTKLKQGAKWGINNENKTNKYVERRGKKEKKARIDIYTLKTTCKGKRVGKETQE